MIEFTRITMSNEYKDLEARIGQAALRQALMSQKTDLLVAFAGIVGIAFFWTGGKRSDYMINAVLMMVAVAVTISIYAKTRLAKTMSRQLSMKVHWYEIPAINKPIEYNRWLDKKLGQADR